MKFFHPRYGWLLLWMMCLAMVAVRVVLLDRNPSPSGLSRVREMLLTIVILLMATAGYRYRWSLTMWLTNFGLLLGDSPEAVSGVGKREFVFSLMFLGFLLGFALESFLRLVRRGSSASLPE